jgi:DNA-binding GntR family transcriptional regulator
MTDVFQAMKNMAKPIDPDMRIGFTRYCKIKFWDNFLMIAEWFSNKKRAFKAQRQMHIHQEVLQAMKEKDYEALEKLRNKRLGLANRIFENQIQNSD